MIYSLHVWRGDDSPQVFSTRTVGRRPKKSFPLKKYRYDVKKINVNTTFVLFFLSLCPLFVLHKHIRPRTCSKKIHKFLESTLGGYTHAPIWDTSYYIFCISDVNSHITVSLILNWYCKQNDCWNYVLPFIRIELIVLFLFRHF